MRIQKARLIDFNSPVDQIVDFEILVPQHSVRLDLVALNDGVYVSYLVPDEPVDMTMTRWNFRLLLPDAKIDIAEFDFVQTISIFVPQTDGQGNAIPDAPPQVIMFPVFLKRE